MKSFLLSPRSNNAIFLLLVPALMLLIVFFVYPLLNLLSTSADNGQSFQFYRRLFNTPVILTVLRNTVVVSSVVTFLCFIFGYPAAYFLAHTPPKARPILFLLILLPLWTSVLIRSYSWIVMLGKNGVINIVLIEVGLISEPLEMIFTTPVVYLALVQIFLPIMILTCYSVMTDINPDLVKAARVLGASPWNAFRKVYFPLSASGVQTGAVFIFILSMGVFVTPALVGSRKDVMSANLIEYQVTQLVSWGFASAQSVALLLTTIVIVVIFRMMFGNRVLYR